MSAQPDRNAEGRRKRRAGRLPDAGPEARDTAPKACPIVGVGASAGGLEAFTRLLRALPERVGMALVLVQHLDPSHESLLADILRRESKMPVSDAVDGGVPERDHVYVMPANVTMTVSGGALRLTPRDKASTDAHPIDGFLSALAEECGSRAIGVILSGTGADGALGLRAIKEAGGLTLAQDPTTSDYDGMPRAAIESGSVDSVLDPEHIAGELVRLGGHPVLTKSGPPKADLGDADEQTMREILSLVREASGLDLTDYRRTTLLRRISRRMMLDGIDTMKDYMRYLHENPAEVDALYRDILVNMTEFFRDPDSLDALKREVFPDILERKPEGAIRVWVPGCSKGQEAYSILITLVEFLDGRESKPDIQMFASDVNEQDVSAARAGIYPESIAGAVSPERLARFFVQVPEGYQIDRSIRELCVFAVHDVTKDPPFSKLDLVSFRNVLIYMERPLQERVLQILHYALEPGGLLLLGSSETTGAESTLFSPVDKKRRIFRRNPGPARLLPALAPSVKQIGFAGKTATAEAVEPFDAVRAADRIVQGHYQPSGILVNSSLDVLQFRGHVGRYLDPAEGRPELRLPRILAPGLSSAAEGAIREATATRGAARKRGFITDAEGVRRDVDVEAVPIGSPSGEVYHLVLFEERTPDVTPSEAAAAEGTPAATDVAELRRRLDETQESLEAIIAEKESANSGLRDAGEKLQSSNEELRTINEEFQTAQEELQSTNEELTTLNDELRNRNNELGLLSDDLTNVLEGVEIPILILGPDLHIRRFTPEAGRIVRIVPADIGRSITDLNMRIDMRVLQAEIMRVLNTEVASQTDLRSTDGRWLSMRVRPYRTGNGTIDGVVVAFLDVDSLKRASEAAQAAQAHAEAVLETVREPLLTLDAQLHVSEANDAFYRTFDTSPEDTLGVSVFELGNRQWDFPELRSLLDHVLPGDREFTDLQVEHDFPAIGKRIMVLSARRIREEEPEAPSILLAIDDATDVKRREATSAALTEISRIIGSTPEFSDALPRILKESIRTLGADSGALLLKTDGRWVMQSVHVMPASMKGRLLEESQVPISRLAVANGRPVFFDDILKNEAFASSVGIDLKHRAVLMVPLLLREETVGSLSFHYRTPIVGLGPVDMDFAKRLGALLSLAFENARLYETQREIANTLQSALLTVPRRIPGLGFGHLYRSATAAARVGGDFYDIFELDRGRAGVLIGDVSGKGIRAATLTALAKNTIRALAYENDSPAALVAKTNDVILKATPLSSFITLMYGVIDLGSGRLVYCSAGHTRGIVKRRAGGFDLLDVGSPLAGALEDVEFVDGETTLETGDVLVLYTDGVTEARRDGELYGEERLTEFIGGLGPTPSAKLPKLVFDEVRRFTGGKLSDDVAIIALGREA